jgi:hypothetical protein
MKMKSMSKSVTLAGALLVAAIAPPSLPQPPRLLGASSPARVAAGMVWARSSAA